MSCATVRDRLLAAERPDRPAAGEARHLSGCPECQAWLRQLVGLERALPLLPVPASSPPATLFAALATAPAGPTLVRLPDRGRPEASRRREGGRQKLALASALAAALLLFALGWWAWPHGDGGGLALRAERIDYQDRRDQRLAPARTPAQRLAALSDFADDLLAEARANPLEPERLARVARDFDRLADDLPRQARDIPPADRAAAVTPVLVRLRHINSEASRLAVEWAHERIASHTSLREVARSARVAELRLQALARV